MTAGATPKGLIDTSAPNSSLQQIQWAIAAGTADAITATYPQTIDALSDGLVLAFRALLANATIAPTFSPDNQPPYAITKKNNIALAASDIAGNDQEMVVRFNANTKTWLWVNR